MKRSTNPDRLRQAAERRGATLDTAAGDWLYGGRTVPQWLDAIRADGSLRPEAARVAQKQIGPEAAPHVVLLTAALDDPGTYDFACLALGGIGAPAALAVATLLRFMRAEPRQPEGSGARGDEDACRSFAARAVAAIGAPPPALDELVAALQDSYFAVGRNAAAALGDLGARAAAAAAVPALIAALDDPQLTLRAAQALGRIGEPAGAAGAALAAVAARNDWHESTAAAAEAIGRIGYAEGAAVLRGLLDDRFADVRKAAAGALDRLGVSGG